MKYTIQKFGDALRLNSTEKSLSTTKKIDYSFCFFYALGEIATLLIHLLSYDYIKAKEYCDLIRQKAIKQSIYYHGNVDYSFCFFYVLDEIKEFLAEQQLSEDQIFILKNWM